VLLDDDGVEKLADLIDFPYSETYKQNFHQFNYVPKYPDAKKQRKQKKKNTESKVEADDPEAPKKPYIKLNLFEYHETEDDQADNKVSQKFVRFESYHIKS